ncbi:MAG: YggS family pyridoxal phosphate-dependent enzyme [Microthrixaceae bacterium]
MTSPDVGADTAREIRRNLDAVLERIDAAARRAGRDPSAVRLLPVSKTVPVARLRLAVAAGCRQLGENKVQEALDKATAMADLDVSWCVIGHLQTNKARHVAAFADEFHALDSERVAAALDRRLQALGRTLQVYVQVNTSGEESKFGLAPEQLSRFLEDMAPYRSLKVQGLMTLAALSADPDRVRRCFILLRELRDRAVAETPELLGSGELSMGMSGDFETAVEEGSTCVRVGQAIFGARPLPDSHYWPDAR